MISKEIKFLLTHSSIYGLGTMVTQLVSFLLLPLYTRFLTPSDYGLLETINISSGIIGIVVTVGIARAMSRFYYESDRMEERNTVVSTTLIMYFSIAAFFFPFLYFVSDPASSILFGTHQYGFYFKISFVSLLLGGLIDIGLLYLRLTKKPTTFISVTTARLIFLISFNILFIVHFRLGVLGILYSSLIVRILFSVGMTSAILWKTGTRVSKKISIDILKYGIPMIPSNLGNAAVKQSDRYFILFLLSISDLGIYSLAMKLGNAIHTLLTIPFNMAYIPRRFEIMKLEDAKETFKKIFTYYIFLVGFVGLALSMLIPEIIVVMVTPRFYGAKDIIPLVVVSLILLGCHYHFDFGILYSKKTNYLAFVNLSSAAVQLFLNVILISRFGLLGAVWASITSLSFQAYLLYRISNRYFPINYEFLRITYYCLTGFFFFFLSRQLALDNHFYMIMFKLVLLAVFIWVILRTGIVTPNETARIRETYRKKVKPLIYRGAVSESVPFE